MREYGIPFNLIETTWTEEQFQLFVQTIIRRREEERKAIEKAHGKQHGRQRYR